VTVGEKKAYSTVSGNLGVVDGRERIINRYVQFLVQMVGDSALGGSLAAML
jgi:hypothetical protein